MINLSEEFLLNSIPTVYDEKLSVSLDLSGDILDTYNYIEAKYAIIITCKIKIKIK